MTRVRTDNVFGTVTDNPLTDSATTLNSAGLANLAAVSSAEAIIILDPNRVSGAPEIVVVTAHTGSATSATIVRGQFGTSAREHAAGTEWVHGPIASNASSFVTAADDQGDFVPMNAWESWTPTFANFTLGNGTLDAAFTRIGRTIHYRMKVTLGSTSSMGATPTFTLPVAPAASYANGVDAVGSIMIGDSGTADFNGTCRLAAGSAVTLTVDGVAGTYSNQVTWTSAVPMTWTTNDRFIAYGTYEAAS